VEFPRSLTTIGQGALAYGIGIRTLRMHRVLWDSIRATLPENPSTSQRVTFYDDPNLYLVMRSNSSSGIVIDYAAQDAAEEERQAALAAEQTRKDVIDRELRGSISVIMNDGSYRAQPFMQEAKLQSNLTALDNAKSIMEVARSRAQEKQRQIHSASTAAEATSYINGKEFTVQDITSARTMIQNAIDRAAEASNTQRSDAALMNQIESDIGAASRASRIQMSEARTQLNQALATLARTTIETAKTYAYLLQRQISVASTRTNAYNLIMTTGPSELELTNLENDISRLLAENNSVAFLASIVKLLDTSVAARVPMTMA
jgi:hypothetical protein